MCHTPAHAPAPASASASAPVATAAPRPALAPTTRTALLGGLPRAFWVLWAGTLVNRLGGAVFPFLAVYLTRERGLSAERAGLVVGLYAAGGMIAGPAGGALADRAGRRPTLLLGTTGAAAAMLGLGFAPSAAAIVLLAPLLGFFTDLCRPPLNAAVADLVPAAERTRAYGLLYWAINLGFAGAAALAGALAQVGFSILFVVDALTTLAFGALVLLGVPESLPARTAVTAPGRPPPREPGRWRASLAAGAALFAPFRAPRFARFLGLQALVYLVFQQVLLALPLDMRAHGLSTAEVGRLLALNGIAIVLVQPLLVRVLARLPRARVLSTGAALIGLGYGVAALAGGVPVFAASILVWTLGEILTFTATPSLIAELAPPAARARYQGAHQLVWGLTGIVAPPLGGLVLRSFGGGTLWVGCAVIGLGAAVLYLVRGEG
jgi:MFS family permease